MQSYKILTLPGDGVGPEVLAQALDVLVSLSAPRGLQFEFEADAIGAAAIDQFGAPIRPETLDKASSFDAVLFGAVGDPRFDGPDVEVRPEQAILKLRQALGLYANLRPVLSFDSLGDLSPLRPERVQSLDMMIVRELTGGIYFGAHEMYRDAEGRHATDQLIYHEAEIVRVLEVAFELARSRRGKVTSVDKANVLASSRLWRQVAGEVHARFADVELEHALVDSFAMRIIQDPSPFDVVVTENMFGDILSDEASVLSGSLGLMPSASLGERTTEHGTFGLYEPIHGSAPDLAGRNAANPIGMILSAAMMLEHSLGLAEEARIVEQAVHNILARGARTPDLISTDVTRTDLTAGDAAISTAEMGQAIAAEVRDLARVPRSETATPGSS